MAALDFSQSNCPTSDFFTALYDAGFACKPATLINVGANKGYLVAEMLAIFSPQSGADPIALGNGIRASGRADNEFTACGYCDDCKHMPPQSAAAACPGAPPRITVHAFEPVQGNFYFLENQLAPLLRADGPVSLTLHRAAVVENQTATPSVMFSDCTGGSEVCHIIPNEAAVQEGYKAVMVPTVSLDRFADSAGLGVVDFLFVDAEGYDPSVLRGAGGLLGAGRVRALVFEYNRMNNWDHEELGDLLSYLEHTGGFDCWLLQDGFAVLLTGCWDRGKGKSWSNVLCVRREERALHAVMVSMMP